MKKIFIFSFFIIFWFSNHNVFWECNYLNEIDKCIKANKDSEAREITEFVCPSTDWRNTEKIAYQIIFDQKFKEIDKDVENFLETLQSSIQYYYWPEKKESFLDWINYINETFNPNWILWKRYNKFCVPAEVDSILNNFYSCLSADESQKYSTIKEWSTYFSKSNCEGLVEYKLFIYKKVAYNLLQVNKLDFLKEFRKKQLKSTREKYDQVIWNMYVNLDNIIRINNQRNKVTNQCQYIAPDP